MILLQSERCGFWASWAVGRVIPYFRWWRGARGWQLGLWRFEIGWDKHQRN